jgi:glycosyltransferase involved in cell wall biosynthesis
MNNVPCVASSLPGVRRPIQMHQMGQVVPIGDPAALSNALLEILGNKEKYRCDTDALVKLYDPDTVAQEYEKLFERLMK